MLIRGLRHLLAILGSLLFITSFLGVTRLYNGHSVTLPYFSKQWNDDSWGGDLYRPADYTSSSSSSQDTLANPAHIHDHDDEFDLSVYGKPVHEIFSISTRNKKYFSIDFGDYEALNPNIIPHPHYEDTWIVVAQQPLSKIPNSVWSAELVCNAKFRNDKLVCSKSPVILPIPATFSDGCTDNLAFLAFNVGPHDARAFYGPNNPYTIWGTQSAFTCFGQWIQDLRILTDWGVTKAAPTDPNNPFVRPTELQRPAPWGKMEKNWFLFWDAAGQMFAHFDLNSKRSFAQIAVDGSAGPDLAPLIAADDEKCMARFMPRLAPSLESIHQATNSLSVTLCKRHDPGCTPNDFNTYVMTIFQHKTFYNFHSVYEPYVMLFQRNAPFAVHGISTKPIWIHGRGKAEKPDMLGPDDQWDETEMFYVTSMSWKQHGMKYHGYIDDAIFLGFGIEDKRSGGIDVVVGDILEHIGLCSDTNSFGSSFNDVHALSSPEIGALQ